MTRTLIPALLSLLTLTPCWGDDAPTPPGPAPVWTHELEKAERQAVAAVTAEVVVLREDGELRAYGTAEGKALWQREAFSRSVVQKVGGLLLEQGRGGQRLIVPATGKLQPLPKGSLGYQLPHVADDMILVLIDDRLVALEPGRKKPLWSYPKASKKKKKKKKRKALEKVDEFLRVGERIVVAGPRFMIGLDLKGRQRWAFDCGEVVAGRGKGRVGSVTFTQERRPHDLKSDGKIVSALSFPRFWFLNVENGKKKGQIDLKKLDDEDGGTNPSHFALLPGKRSSTLVVRRPKNERGNRFVMLSSKGKKGHAIKLTPLETVTPGPDFSCLLSNREELECYSGAWRKLWSAKGKLLAYDEGEPDAILTHGEKAISRLDPAKGKVVATHPISSFWTTYLVPQRLFLFDHENLVELSSQTLEVVRTIPLEDTLKNLRKVHWAPGGVVLETKTHVSWLPIAATAEKE